MRLPPYKQVALTGVAALAWIATLADASVDNPAPVGEAGQGLFDQHCAACHGSHGKGDGPEAPFLSPRPGSLVSAATSVKSDSELLSIIENGKPRTAMPAWKNTLTESQQQEVLAYIRGLIRFQKPGTPPPP
jgi:mono/diheme cytochrome c family protein